MEQRIINHMYDWKKSELGTGWGSYVGNLTVGITYTIYLVQISFYMAVSLLSHGLEQG